MGPRRRFPNAARASGARGLRRDRHPRHRRLECPPPETRQQGPKGAAYKQRDTTRAAQSRTGWEGVIPPGGRRSHRAGASGVPDALAGVGGGAAASCRRRGAPRRAALLGRSRRRRERSERAQPATGKQKKRSVVTVRPVAGAGETQRRTQPPAGPAIQKRSCSEEPGCQPVGQVQAVSAASAAAGAGDLSCHSRGRTAASSCNSSSTGLERSSTTRSSPEISSGGSNSLSCPW
jgi:hypothetical protein